MMENVVLSDTWLYYWLCNYQIHGTFEDMKNWSKVNSLKNKSLLNSINPLSASVAIIEISQLICCATVALNG